METGGAKPKGSERLRALLPDIWEILRPRRWSLAVGLALILVNRAASLVLPGSMKPLVDDVIGKQRADLLLPLIAAVGGATVLQGITSFSLTQLLSKSAQRVIAELRRKVQVHVGRLPVAYYDANKAGTLVSRIMNDVEGMRNLVGTGLVGLLGSIVTAAIALVLLIRISPLMTAIAVVVLAAFALFLRRAFGIQRPIFRERRKIYAEVTGRLTETLGGVRVVKGYHAEDREAAVFSGGVQRLLDNTLLTLTMNAWIELSATVLMGGVTVLMMYIGAREISSHTITLGAFITFTAYLAYLVAPVAQIVNMGPLITEAIAGLERMREVMRERPEGDDPRRTLALDGIRGEVRFEEVTFEYEAGKPVLHGVSFEALPGTVTALVGSSGSGKSTIIGLVAAFHTPTSGAIRIDGVDLSTVLLDSYRTRLGVVLQDTFLFDGTIRENVLFGRPDATEEEFLHACRIARVDEFADEFEKGYETVVGERGVKLSGGQKQRVAIARAIVANPRILILDEATSSLDSESEASIQQGLAYLMEGRTTFVIAHRLSTIRRADNILVVEAGRVIERGTHPSLLAARGRYWDLYTRQHGAAADLFLAPGEGVEAAEAAGGNGESGAPPDAGSAWPEKLTTWPGADRN